MYFGMELRSMINPLDEFVPAQSERVLLRGFILSTEEWKVPLGYDGVIEVSNLGNVRNFKTKKHRSTFKGPKGYMHVRVNGGSPRNPFVHRLVALAFLGEIKPGDQVDHIDGNKTNNNLQNLRRCTKRQNQNFYVKSKNPGAFFETAKGKWSACISIKGKNVRLGHFENAEAASAAYLKKVRELNENTYPESPIKDHTE